ncbi:hypothetical protein HAZT_HAZT004909 [Hyalella azteca]|uniref:Uncharacterized protein n=1 Tax=Hyalella azteca TaxID=294128 RepID=A0A6A0H0D0_HYAAZ|nr:hypothetical protein HAZT_HAZT004909 [Hyalella azteca]
MAENGGDQFADSFMESLWRLIVLMKPSVVAVMDAAGGAVCAEASKEERKRQMLPFLALPNDPSVRTMFDDEMKQENVEMQPKQEPLTETTLKTKKKTENAAEVETGGANPETEVGEVEATVVIDAATVEIVNGEVGVGTEADGAEAWINETTLVKDATTVVRDEKTLVEDAAGVVTAQNVTATLAIGPLMVNMKKSMALPTARWLANFQMKTLSSARFTRAR